MNTGDPEFVANLTQQCEELASRPAEEAVVPILLHRGPYDGLVLTLPADGFHRIAGGDQGVMMPVNREATLVALYRLLNGPVSDAHAVFLDYGMPDEDSVEDCGG